MHTPKTKVIARRPPADVAVASIEDDLREAAELLKGARTKRTRERYQLALRHWMAYADANGLARYPVEPDALCAFIGRLHREGYALGTIKHYIASVGKWHSSQGDTPPNGSPKVKEVMRGVAKKAKPPRKPKALTAAVVRRMLLATEGTAGGERDAAVIVIGFVTGQRRSELAAMEWGHIAYEGTAMVVTIPRSKTDQLGEGQLVTVPRGPKTGVCPQRILKRWQKVQGARGKGSVFGISDTTIYRLIKRRIEQIGLDPGEYSPHSLRHGMVTEAKRGGAKDYDIMGQSRHKSARMIEEYTQQIDAANNEAAKIVVARLQETP